MIQTVHLKRALNSLWFLPCERKNVTLEVLCWWPMVFPALLSCTLHERMHRRCFKEQWSCWLWSSSGRLPLSIWTILSYSRVQRTNTSITYDKCSCYYTTWAWYPTWIKAKFLRIVLNNLVTSLAWVPRNVNTKNWRSTRARTAYYCEGTSIIFWLVYRFSALSSKFLWNWRADG